MPRRLQGEHRRPPWRAPGQWPLFPHVLGALLLVVLAAGGLYLLLTWLLGVPRQLGRPPATTDVHGIVLEVTKVTLTVAAALGATVALVVAYRRTRVEESAGARDVERLFTDRFESAATLLGDGASAVRLAGVYAMARLADDWPEQQQTCVDVLCAYLRIPPEQPDLPAGEREVRLTVFRVVADHLRGARGQPSWRGRTFDLTGVVFLDGEVSFDGVRLAGSRLLLDGAIFDGGTVSFQDADVGDGELSFRRATFRGGELRLDRASVSSGGTLSFRGAVLGGTTTAPAGTTPAGTTPAPTADAGTAPQPWVRLDRLRLSGGEVSFEGAELATGGVRLARAVLTGGRLTFEDATLSGGQVVLDGAKVSGSTVSFIAARVTAGVVSFHFAAVEGGGRVAFGGLLHRHGRDDPSLEGATIDGGLVTFAAAELLNGSVTFKKCKVAEGAVSFGPRSRPNGLGAFYGPAELRGATVDLTDLRRATVDQTGPPPPVGAGALGIDPAYPGLFGAFLPGHDRHSAG